MDMDIDMYIECIWNGYGMDMDTHGFEYGMYLEWIWIWIWIGYGMDMDIERIWT